MICFLCSSYVGENKEFERQYLQGELEVELTPQVQYRIHCTIQYLQGELEVELTPRVLYCVLFNTVPARVVGGGPHSSGTILCTIQYLQGEFEVELTPQVNGTDCTVIIPARGVGGGTQSSGTLYSVQYSA